MKNKTAIINAIKGNNADEIIECSVIPIKTKVIKPTQLTKSQVETLKQQNNGAPIKTELVKIDSKGIYMQDFNINENDVYLLNFKKQ